MEAPLWFTSKLRTHIPPKSPAFYRGSYIATTNLRRKEANFYIRIHPTEDPPPPPTSTLLYSFDSFGYTNAPVGGSISPENLHHTFCLGKMQHGIHILSERRSDRAQAPASASSSENLCIFASKLPMEHHDNYTCLRNTQQRSQDENSHFFFAILIMVLVSISTC